MRSGKKTVHLILAGILFVLSLGMISACQKDEEINVIRESNDVYSYNGERYVYVENMYSYVERKINAYQVGYAYNGIFSKIPVYGANYGIEQDVLIFRNHHFNHQFYVKESVCWPDTLEIKCTGILSNKVEPSEYFVPILTEEVFTLKEILSMDDVLDKSELPHIEKWGICSFTLLGYDSLHLQKTVEIDADGNMYMLMHEEDTSYPLGYYKIIDEKIKELIEKEVYMHEIKAE